MNTFVKRFLSIVLTVIMLSLSCVAFAAGPNIGGDLEVSDPGNSTGSSGPVGYTITFVHGTGYDLTAQTGTSKNTEGDVLVTGVSGVISEKKIPVLTTSDEYYRMNGWYIKDENGKRVSIDLETYRFTKNTSVFADVEDIWPPYLDMKQDRTDWYYRYVRDLSIQGVVNGYPGYTFAPQGNVTWGEALKLVMLAAGYEEQAQTDTHWASGYLTKALEDGLVTPEQNVVLGDPITRLEYAQVAAKALGLQEVSIVTPFVDTDDMSVLELYAAGIIEGSFNTAGQRQFLPDDYITRAEISTVIWRINNYRQK